MHMVIFQHVKRNINLNFITDVPGRFWQSQSISSFKFRLKLLNIRSFTVLALKQTT